MNGVIVGSLLDHLGVEIQAIFLANDAAGSAIYYIYIYRYITFTFAMLQIVKSTWCLPLQQ